MVGSKDLFLKINNFIFNAININPETIASSHILYWGEKTFKAFFLGFDSNGQTHLWVANCV
jgi:hypothetical protein